MDTSDKWDANVVWGIVLKDTGFHYSFYLFSGQRYIHSQVQLSVRTQDGETEQQSRKFTEQESLPVCDEVEKETACSDWISLSSLDL